MCIPKFYPPHFKMNIAITSHYISLYTSQQTSHFIPLTTTSRYIAENIPWPMGWALSPLPSRSSSCTCSLGITFERDRGIFIEAEGGVLAYEVTQAIHHMRVIGHKSETAIGTSAPGRWWIGLWGGVAVQVLLQDHLWVGTGKKTTAKEAFNVGHSRICAHPSAITAHIILAKGVVCRQIEGWIGTSVPIICRWTARRPHIWNLPNICAGHISDADHDLSRRSELECGTRNILWASAVAFATQFVVREAIVLLWQDCIRSWQVTSYAYIISYARALVQEVDITTSP